MPDPFDALRLPGLAVDPDPDFAARLRARVARALSLPEGVIVSETTLDNASETTLDIVAGAAADLVAAATHGPRATPGGLIPYLAVADAERALDWYVEALGARRVGEPMVMPDGRIGHAELAFGPSTMYLAEAGASSEVAAPDASEPATVTLHVEVADVDDALRHALDAGASLERPAADYPYGRNAVMRDPFGHRWLVSAPAPAEPDAPSHGAVGQDSLRHGDIAYASLGVPDVERATMFFGHVLGWQFAPGSGPEGRQVEGQALSQGLWGGHPHSTLFLCYMVDDVDAAVDAVRAAGGSAEDPSEEPYGRVVNCTDDQGTAFAVFHPPAGTAPGGAPALNGERHGDLAYITVETPDTGRARAFYGALLGWRFVPGSVEDGWQVEGPRPMVGLAGSRDATTVPFYRVDDVQAAVRRVEEAGGTPGDVEVQPYGSTALCTDDQGTRFYLGQM